MRLLALEVQNFRGISRARIVPSWEGVTVVHGPNEVGKSSLCEALSLCFDLPADSRHARVRAVRTVGLDRGPAVEVSMELEGRRLEYRKRFLKEPEETLTEIVLLSRDEVAEGPRDEVAGRSLSFSGREAHDRIRELLEGSAGYELFRALLSEQGRGADLVHLERAEGLLGILEADAGELEGGDLAGRILETYEESWTGTGRVKRNGVLDLARKRLEEAESRCRILNREAGELEADLKALEVCRNRLPDLIRARNRWRKEVEGRRGKWEEVRALEQKLRKTEAEEKEAGARFQELRSRLEAREEKAEEERGLSGRLEKLDHRIREGEIRILESAIRIAKELSSRREECERLLEGDGPGPESGEEADRLETALAALGRAGREGEGGRVRLEALRRLELRGSDAPELEEGEVLEIDLDRERVLEIPGILRLHLLPGTWEPEQRKKRECLERKLRSLLAQWECVSVEELRGTVRRREAARKESRELESLQRSLEAMIRPVFPAVVPEEGPRAPGRRTWAEDLERVLEEIRGDEERGAWTSSPGLDRGRVEETLEEVRGLVGRLLSDRREASSLKEMLRVLRRRLEEDREEMTDPELRAAVEKAEKDLEGRRAALDRAEREAEAASLEEVKQGLEEALREERKAEQELERCRRDADRLEGRLERRRADGLYEEIEEAERERLRAEEEAERVERRAAAAALLKRCWEEAREKRSVAWKNPLEGSIAELGRGLWGEGFGVRLDENLKIEARILEGRELPFEALSFGAREQLALLHRLACCRLFTKEGRAFPLVLDDCFGHSDPERMARIGRVLSRPPAGMQILIFTCVPERYRGIEGALFLPLSS